MSSDAQTCIVANAREVPNAEHGHVFCCCVCGAVLPHKTNRIHECVTLAHDFIAVGTEPCCTTLCLR